MLLWPDCTVKGEETKTKYSTDLRLSHTLLRMVPVAKAMVYSMEQSLKSPSLAQKVGTYFYAITSTVTHLHIRCPKTLSY